MYMALSGSYGSPPPQIAAASFCRLSMIRKTALGSYHWLRYGEIDVPAGLPAPASTVSIIACRSTTTLMAWRTLVSEVNGSAEGIPRPR